MSVYLVKMNFHKVCANQKSKVQHQNKPKVSPRTMNINLERFYFRLITNLILCLRYDSPNKLVNDHGTFICIT